jgi:hypothetical protein
MMRERSFAEMVTAGNTNHLLTVTNGSPGNKSLSMIHHTSVPDSRDFDADPRICITGLRIRILLFSSVTQDTNQK